MTTEIEIWRDVVGLEKFFEVSNMGRVRSKTNQLNSLGRVCMRKGKLIHDPSTHFNRRKSEIYIKINLRNYDTGVVKNYRVHRLVCEAFHDFHEMLHKPFINHIDGNKWNNRSDNLEWCTPSENTCHAIERGLVVFKSGEESKYVVHNEHLIRNVLNLYFFKLKTCNEISKIVNINKEYINLVVNGKRWSELFSDYISLCPEYYLSVLNILSKRRVVNREKVEEKVYELQEEMARKGVKFTEDGLFFEKNM